VSDVGFVEAVRVRGIEEGGTGVERRVQDRNAAYVVTIGQRRQAHAPDPDWTRCERRHPSSSSGRVCRYDSVGGRMSVKFKIFKSSIKSWPDLCTEAAAFASEQGRDRLINVSVSEDHNDGVIIVWYWE
jgi:hypothetical protein